MKSWLLAALLVGSAQGEAKTENDSDVIQKKYIHKYGVELSAQDWDARGKNGAIYTTLKNGVVIKRTFSNGVPDGETTTSFPHSEQIENQEIYTKGVLTREVTNNISGQPLQEDTYETPETKQITLWYESGTAQSIEQYHLEALQQAEYFNKQNQVESKVADGQGSRTRRDKFGQLLSVDTIENGYMALRTTYHPNGYPLEVTPYLNHLIDGKKQIFQPDGSPVAVECWKQGKRTGITTLFERGDKTAEVPYLNGVRNGVEKRFKENAVVTEEITWVNDIKHGPAINYIGNAIKTEWFLKGKIVTKKEFELQKRG